MRPSAGRRARSPRARGAQVLGRGATVQGRLGGRDGPARNLVPQEARSTSSQESRCRCGRSRRVARRFIRSAFSANIRSGATLHGALRRGRMIDAGGALPVHPAPCQRRGGGHRPRSGVRRALTLNHPYAGGTHLLDLTIVTHRARVRGHPRASADVGGSEPGSSRRAHARSTRKVWSSRRRLDAATLESLVAHAEPGRGAAPPRSVAAHALAESPVSGSARGVGENA